MGSVPEMVNEMDMGEPLEPTCANECHGVSLGNFLDVRLEAQLNGATV